MKKFATVLLSICLVFSMCVASFAAVPDLTYTSKATIAIREVVRDLGANPSDADREAAAKAIITILEENGAETKGNLRTSADTLLSKGIIDKPLYTAINTIIDKTEAAEEDKAQAILEQIKAIVNDSSLSATEKITKMYELIKNLPAEEVQKILDAAKEKGIIDEETYNKISDLFNGNGNGNGKVEIPEISGDGIKDLVSKVLGKLGIGGGSGDNSKGGSGSGSSGSGSSSSGSNKTDFEGGNAKTGDYTIASVAGIAAIAGAALVLTKKKNEDK